jgi:3-hydroxybutyryl-CoA dehydrogenase
MALLWKHSNKLSGCLALHSKTHALCATPLRRQSTATSQSSIKTFGVVGCGQMGTGIALVAARNAGLKVHAYDNLDASIQRSQDFVKGWVAKEIKKGRMTDESGKLLQEGIEYCNLSDSSVKTSVPTLDFVVEAVSEDVEIKRVVYARLQEVGLRTDSVLGTNTSSISISKLARTLERPERVIGMHFMNPVPVMPLVEVIRGLRTDDETHAKTLELCSMMGKESATSKDRPGFIANRILMQNINAAILAFQDDIATRDDIDKIMKLGTNVPMGPLQLADFIGLDTCLYIMRVLTEDLGDQYRPAPLLVNYVEAGLLGVKTKRGFYEY